MRALRGSEGTGRGGLRRGAVGRIRPVAYTRTIGVLGLAFLGLIFYIGYEAPNVIPGRSYYNLYANIPAADNVGPHFQVRIGGELAGQVLDPKVEHGLAHLHLQLASKFKPLRASTKLEVRLRSAVGVRYIQLIPGTTGAALPQNGVLGPSSEITTPVNIDDILDVFDKETRTRTQQFLQELGAGFMGQGDSVNGFIGSGPAFFGDLSTTAAAINSRPQAMHNFISSAQNLAAAFDPVRGTIATGFQPETQALRVFTDAGPQVQQTLDQLPPTLTNISSTLPAVSSLLSKADSFAANTKVTLADAPAALNQTVSLLRDARTPMRNLSTTLGLAQSAVPPTLQLLQAIPPALPTTNTAMNDLMPLLRYEYNRSCDLSNAFTGWSEPMKWGSTSINWIEFYIGFLPGIVSGGNPPDVLLGANAQSPNLSFNDTLTTPYPGPCVNGSGEAGTVRPTAEEAAQGLSYNSSGHP